jgi:hypothetical protein
MYVITHHHDYDEVLLGPIEWNPRFIASVLQTDLDLPFRPVIKDTDKDRVPYDIVENVRVRPVTFVTPDHDPKTQFLVGPYWSYTENEATATYNVEYKNIDIVRGEIKQELAAKRYEKEVSGVKVTLQGQEVSLTTMRGDRELYAQKYLLMGDSDTIEWKFPEGWMTLTKSEMLDVVNAVNNHVQSAFAWELGKAMTLDASATHAELTSVSLTEG